MRHSLLTIILITLLLVSSGIAKHGPSVLAANEQPALTPEYIPVDLGDFTVTAINNAGQVVGWRGNRAVLWENGSSRELGFGKATGINDQGFISGVDDVTAVHQFRRGWVWVKGREYTITITNNPNVWHVVPADISNNNTVVGSYIPDHLRWQAFQITGIDDDGDGVPEKWFEDRLPPPGGDGYNDLLNNMGTLAGYPTAALAINNSGAIVGYSVNLFGRTHAFMSSSGELVDLGALDQTHDTSMARAISDSGIVVGNSATDGGNKGFRYGPLGMENLDPNNAFMNSIANGANSAGTIVGDTDSSGAYRWDSVQGIQPLNNLIPAGTGWDLRSAAAINDSGQIVGNGFHDGVWRAFMLRPALQLPLVFIPGISGSTLKIREGPGAGREIWLAIPSGILSRRELSMRPGDQPGYNVYAPDVIRYAELAGIKLKSIYGPLLEALITNGGYVEYDVAGLPERRTTENCDTSQGNPTPTLFVFAYDWRLSNIENARLLKDYIGCVSKFHPGLKVNVLAHSMGGLLARRYILDSPDTHNVNALITIGSPWLGAPKLFNVLETGDFIPMVAGGAGVKYAAESMTGGHQLMPSRAYYRLGAPLFGSGSVGESHPPYGEAGWDLDGNGFAWDVYDYERMVSVLSEKRYTDTQPGLTAREFHDYTAPSGAQDDWQDDATGVKYYHLYSLQAANNTIGQVLAVPKVKLVGEPKLDWKLRFTPGDGTVPLTSLSRIGSGGTDLNAPGAQRLALLSPAPYADETYDHVAFPNHPLAISKIFQLLYQASQPDALFNGTTTTSSTGIPDPQLTAAPQYDLTIDGADIVTVADALDHSTAPIAGDLVGQVPGVSTFTTGPRIMRLLMGTTHPLTVTIHTTEELLAIDLLATDGITPTLGIHYQDLGLPADVTATLVFTPGVSPANLHYDSDGDGIFETEVVPNVVVSGMAAIDVQPPHINIVHTGSLTSAQVTLFATDVGTGVAQIYFSLSGNSFQPYTHTLNLDLTQTPVLFAFADDAAGNRSALETFILTRRIFLPVVVQ